jgi:hypothetical protein
MLIHPWDAAAGPAEWQDWLASSGRFGMLAVNNLDRPRARWWCPPTSPWPACPNAAGSTGPYRDDPNDDRGRRGEPPGQAALAQQPPGEQHPEQHADLVRQRDRTSSGRPAA